MDLLRRYHKPGGFLQLVQLIETCGPQKQQQLLTSIEKESLEWANEVRAKILTINRISAGMNKPWLS
jgi:flagellar motor switch protein FliG